MCVSFQAYTRRRLWSDRDQIWHTHAYSPRKGSGKNKDLPRVTPGWILGGLGGQKLKNLEKLPNGWTNCHQIWNTCADSSGNGHRLKTVSSSRPKVGTWGVLGGQKCKSQENLPSGCTDWHQICYTSANSSGNGRRLKQLAPRYPRGHFGGF